MVINEALTSRDLVTEFVSLLADSLVWEGRFTRNIVSQGQPRSPRYPLAEPVFSDAIMTSWARLYR